MSILIIAATAAELSPFTDMNERKQGMDISTMVTGVGLLSTALSLTKKIHQNPPGLVIQTGIAGVFNKELSLGQAVAVASDCIGDMGVIEMGAFRNIFQMGLADPDQFPFQAGKLTNPNKTLIRLSGLQAVDAISIHEITTSTNRIQYYQDALGAEIETMEGAAFHMVCLEYNIPFLQIRGLSNWIGERDKSKWMIKEATASAFKAVNQLISNLNPLP